MKTTKADPISLEEGRYARLEAIEWWDQERLKNAHILVIGAGALGNEVLKNLAMLGVGNVVIVDMDNIEMSNLSRSILFRESDQGKSKTESAAKMMKEICPDIQVIPLTGNVLSDIGLGYFRWADVVVGALDNREARLFVNSSCARIGRPWIDGGIEVLQGIVRIFSPPKTACYECTMSQADWDQVNQRRSCSLLARRALALRGIPTTPTTASVIGGIQTQEVIKMLHRLDTLQGKGFFFDGLTHNSYTISYQINPECDWHDSHSTIEPVAEMTSDQPFSLLSDYARTKLGGLDAIDLAREQVKELACPTCNRSAEVWQAVDKIDEDQALCPTCGAERVPVYVHSLEPATTLLDKTPRQMGLPPWDIVWARYGDLCLGLEIAGDNPFEC